MATIKLSDFFRSAGVNGRTPACLLLLCLLAFAAASCGGGGVSNPASAVRRDTAAPGKISNLSAVVRDGKVTLSWQNPDDDDFAGTLIRRSAKAYPANPTAPETEDDKIVYTGEGETFTDSGLTDGQTYFYSVFSFDKNSNYSPGMTATTDFDASAPADASGFGHSMESGKISLFWSNPTDEDFSGVMIRRSEAGFPQSPIAPDAAGDKIVYQGAAENLDDTDLTDGTVYYYSAFAYDAVPNYSAGVNCSVNYDLLPPGGISDFAAVQTDSGISLSWSAPSDADYAGVLIRRGSADYPASATAPETADDAIVHTGAGGAFEDAGVSVEGDYYYAAFAFDEVPNYASATLLAARYDPNPPGDVEDFETIQNDGAVVLRWSSPSDADYAGVMIRRGLSAYPSDPAAAETAEDEIIYSGAEETFTDAGRTNGEVYYYSAFAYDDSANYSAGASATGVAYLPKFNVVVQADTQYYSLGWPYVLVSTNQWIVDHKADKNIVVYINEGDIVHNNTDPEWENAVMYMDVLEGELPYVMSVGNHDIAAGRDTGKFNAYFPQSKFETKPWYGGVFEEGKLDNAYYYFNVNGVDWLVVTLIYDPEDDELEWANQVVDAHPDRRVMVVTHAYLLSNNTRSGIGNNIWNQFVRKHENISFVFNGHYIGDGDDGTVGRLVSDGDNGNKVYQMLANYQDLKFGGLGLLRFLEFDPYLKTVSVTTYSPHFQHSKTDDKNQFVFEDVDFGPQ